MTDRRPRHGWCAEVVAVVDLPIVAAGGTPDTAA
jgi:hypothetical protein